MIARNVMALGGIVAGAVLVASFVMAAQPGEKQPAQRSQTPAPQRLKSPMKSLMHGKLKDGQTVLEGLLVRDFDQVRRGATSLRDKYLTAPDAGDDDDDKVYEHFHIEFMRLSQKLITMAEDENLEGAAFVHQNLTSTCIACHEHMRDRDTDNHVKHAGSLIRSSR